MHAIVVDDSKINLKVAIKMLEHIGLSVDEAESGFECLEKVKNKEYDLIFMDIMMPEMNGITTFNHLKEIEGFNIPVIALTADAVVGAREKYLKLGFNDYIAKPININELKNAITKLKDGGKNDWSKKCSKEV